MAREYSFNIYNSETSKGVLRTELQVLLPVFTRTNQAIHIQSAPTPTQLCFQ
jgi:hypothetical protein